MTDSGNNTVTIERLTPEQPPTQMTGGGADNGGFNSTVSAGTITLNAPLAANGTINVEFILGAHMEGTFRFLVNVEALTGAATMPNDATKAGALGRASGRRKGK